MYTFRTAEPSDCDAIAELVRDLARDIGAKKVPKVTGDSLRAHGFGDQALLMLSIAKGENKLVGACVAALTFSTWRGAPGLYVIDLYVKPAARSGKIGERLLRHAARCGWDAGARFIRMEVDRSNAGAERFYRRLGLVANNTDRIWILEEDSMKDFVALNPSLPVRS